jgi:hypothetical protein
MKKNFRLDLRVGNDGEPIVSQDQEADTFVISIHQRDDKGVRHQQLHIVGSYSQDGNVLIAVNSVGSKVVQHYEREPGETDILIVDE